MIADNADYVYGDSDTWNVKYGCELLKYWDYVNPNENSFVIIHIKGSHGQYKLRYPQSFAKWSSKIEEEAYHNTLLYTDSFLEKVHEYVVKKLNLQLMVYLSDHGDNIKYGHHPDVKTPDIVRIPMLVLVSKNIEKSFLIKLI